MPFIKNAILLVGKSYTPQPIVIGKLAGGLFHTVYVNELGRARGWGFNIAGQLGDTSNLTKRTPVSVRGATKTFCQIAAGGCHTVAIDKNGRAWAWGYNTTDNLPTGQLGDNSTASRRTPVSVAGATKTFCQIVYGNGHTVAIDKNGRAWAWGNNEHGQLGDNTTSSKRTPVSVIGATKTFCQISAGSFFSLAIDINGQVWTWGQNNYGQLGDNTFTSKITPISIVGATKTFCKIAGGQCHTVAIDKNGRAWAWGYNGFGQLGDNSTTYYATPISVLGTSKTFCQLAVGACHTVAIDKNGRAWGWGNGSFGQIGNNTELTIIRTPVSVVGATKTFCQIKTGLCHTVAIDKNGRAWSWGTNNVGQLGDNTTSARRTPVSVVGTTKTFCQIAAQADYTIAIDKNGQAWGWGYNVNGQLGDDSGNKFSPTRVCNL
jgi:alpha-tubulin suppressor-like RCC1 family protein